MPITSRLALAAAATLAASLLAGCPLAPSPLQQSNLRLGEAPMVGVEPVSGGIYESLGDTSKPLSPDALARARLDRSAIRELVKAKVSPSTQPATQPTAQATSGGGAMGGKSTEPPPLAVKYYLQGREHFLQGANSEAMDDLEKALQLDPDAFTVLRLMGRVCFAASQLARGSMYLERAQSLHPNDVEVNYLLGRYWLERRDFDRAVYYLMLADDSPEQQPSSTQMPLSAFYLARSLQDDGFHKAAAHEFERFLEISGYPVPGYRYDRELSYLIDEQWASHLAAAENFARVDDYNAALPHYVVAAADQLRDAYINARLVNALLRTGQADAAQNVALSLLTDTHGADDAIKLLAYTYRVIGRQAQLIPDLRDHLLPASGDDPSTALTIAATQDYLNQKSDAFTTLQSYLERHPTNIDVLTRLLKRVDSAETFRAALHVSAAAIIADRTLADSVVKLFSPLADSPTGAAFFKTATTPVASFAEDYLLAILARLQDAPPDQIDAFYRASLKNAPDFVTARDSYISWLLAEERFPQASRLVQQVVSDNRNSPSAWQLLIESEAAQQRYLSALKLAQDAKKQFPTNTDLRLQLAAIYRLRGQNVEADAELQSIISDNPKFETSYKVLINDLFARSRDTSNNRDDIFRTIVSTLTRLNREIPDSRFGQIHSAILFARSGRLEDAESLLRRLAADNPDDPDILIPLAQIRQALGRIPDAIATLETPLDARPQSDLVRALVNIYNDQDKAVDGLAIAKKFADANADVDNYTLIYATDLSTQKKTPDAIAILENAGKKFPRSYPIALLLARLHDESDDPAAAIAALQSFIKDNGETTDRLYTLARFYSSANNDDGSVATLQRILAIMPDHVGANNDLGYFWTDAGVHLDQAEKMINKAIDNQPNNSAFQDSIGWLFYKQGHFARAADALEKAVAMPDGDEPEVLQHLGDALYRAGRTAQANERWLQAREMLSQVSKPTRDQQKLRDYLDKVLADTKAGTAPTLTPTAVTDSKSPPISDTPDKSAGPTSTTVAPQ
jgi:tetratricopeptide (TPR) repeat protein